MRKDCRVVVKTRSALIFAVEKFRSPSSYATVPRAYTLAGAELVKAPKNSKNLSVYQTDLRLMEWISNFTVHMFT